MKHIIAKRVPPGDRWSIENDEVVHARAFALLFLFLFYL